MLRKLGASLVASVLLASVLLASFNGTASAAPSRPIGTPSGWIEDFCRDRNNWHKVEEWTGREIGSRSDCVNALKGL